VKRAFGSTGWMVSAIGLGGMPMSLQSRPTEADAIRTLHAAFEQSVDWVDTADVYCIDDTDIGHNERLIAKARKSWTGGRIRVATKGGLRRPGGAWVNDGRPEHLKAACEASLRALDVDAIDVYQLHAPDAQVRFEDTIGALAELETAGKVLHVGLSNVTVDQIERARAIVPIVSVQNRCNALDRRAWRDGVLAHCEANGIAFLPWSPVGGSRERRKIAADPTLIGVGRDHGVSPFRVALAWLLAKSPVMLPIPGASRPENATDSARAMYLELTPQDIFVLDRAFPV
jgi:aryl-alcohol dehydrogenase-like predicted oxidoreductase